ncbi:para-nitrobenzyl esterase [Microbacterium terrae]|uniref:Carboxylic ester hydrolase n=1 Tax=Microbacterium terrae TaxID=69369 RepID=A0A0M2H920_9MICO|nr:carboxylesterase family protein [Microbacterium terrae]KJL43030.1 Carboxylesterase [Microbacterium terrae]MBP1079354.1 para-nitrobenzyl esterase [Microbacterium terrae]GLJ98754.1 carboxylic ester hydrolase [Microbacterium terrae]
MAPHPDHPVVATASGDVRGLWRGEPFASGSSAAFLGIPFAQPPVGELRFAAPVPVTPWPGVRDAVEYGPTPQRGDTGITLIPEPSVPGDSTLNVNVFTPAPGDAAAALPVLVYIHGGGFVSGSPASPWYDGRAFNRDGVVTVTVSYRLGFDGFGHIEGAPSNRGVRDWLAALEWVQANISAFGGDPERVTIAGQSAGGGAVLTLLGMPAAQHLFRSAWAMSAAIAGVAPERARTMSAKLAVLAGVAPTREGFASVPEDRLRELQEEAARPASKDRLAVMTTLVDEGLSWGPAIDGDLIAEPTMTSLRSGVGSGKPLVLGATDDEFTMATDSLTGRLRLVPAGLALALLKVPTDRRRAYLADNAPQRRKGTAAMIGRYVTDAVFRSLVVRVAEARTAAGATVPTWVYRFSWASPTRTWALHCLDVPFWFDHLDAAGVTAIAGDAPPRRLADAVHGAAVALIREGDPGWKSWSVASGTTRVFGGAASRPDIDADGYASVRALV